MWSPGPAGGGAAQARSEVAKDWTAHKAYENEIQVPQNTKLRGRHKKLPEFGGGMEAYTICFSYVSPTTQTRG